MFLKTYLTNESVSICALIWFVKEKHGNWPKLNPLFPLLLLLSLTTTFSLNLLSETRPRSFSRPKQTMFIFRNLKIIEGFKDQLICFFSNKQIQSRNNNLGHYTAYERNPFTCNKQDKLKSEASYVAVGFFFIEQTFPGSQAGGQHLELNRSLRAVCFK